MENKKFTNAPQPVPHEMNARITHFSHENARKVIFFLSQREKERKFLKQNKNC